MSQVTSLPHLNFISLDLKTRFVWGKKKSRFIWFFSYLSKFKVVVVSLKKQTILCGTTIHKAY